MSSKTIGALLSLALLTAGLACAKDSPDQQREKIRKMAAATLTDLYKLQPESQSRCPEVGGIRGFQQYGHKPIAAQHRPRRGRGSQLENQAGYLHEDDLRWRRPRSRSEGL